MNMISCSQWIPWLDLVGDSLYHIQNISNKYQELTDISLVRRSSKHSMQCYVKMIGPPMLSLPRWLTPWKNWKWHESALRSCVLPASVVTQTLHGVQVYKWSPKRTEPSDRAAIIVDSDIGPSLNRILCPIYMIFGTTGGYDNLQQDRLLKGYHQIPVAEEDYARSVQDRNWNSPQLFKFLRRLLGWRTRPKRSIDSWTAWWATCQVFFLSI